MLSRRDGKSLDRFLEDYLGGRLKRYVKSEPVPANNNGPVKVCVCVHSLVTVDVYWPVYIYEKKVEQLFIFSHNDKLIMF